MELELRSNSTLRPIDPVTLGAASDVDPQPSVTKMLFPGSPPTVFVHGQYTGRPLSLYGGSPWCHHPCPGMNCDTSAVLWLLVAQIDPSDAPNSEFASLAP